MSARAYRDIEQAATVMRSLQDMRPLTLEEALDYGLHGWNIVCNRCGSYGAEWVEAARPGSHTALCPPHRDELYALRAQVTAFYEVKVRQPPQHEVDQAYKAYSRARAARQKAERAAEREAARRKRVRSAAVKKAAATRAANRAVNSGSRLGPTS